MMQQLRSPLPWIGGKHFSAKYILEAFPHPSTYDTYVEPFGGAASVLIQKPPYRHVEVFNDINEDLVNCWMHLRDNPDQMQSRLVTLPYARSLYYAYHTSLFDGTELSPLERAVRWFYVLRSSFCAAVNDTPGGWLHAYKRVGGSPGSAHSFRECLDFTALSSRFKYVQIDSRDFEVLIQECDTPRVLLYCDSPYIGTEHYYRSLYGVFTMADHERLARVLNDTKAFVALSYYPHPLLDEWYPSQKWRRVTWQTVKHSQRTKDSRDRATELLLCNYPEAARGASLWDVGGAE